TLCGRAPRSTRLLRDLLPSHLCPAAPGGNGIGCLWGCCPGFRQVEVSSLLGCSCKRAHGSVLGAQGSARGIARSSRREPALLAEGDRGKRHSEEKEGSAGAGG